MKTNNFTPLIWVLVASSLNFCTTAAAATANASLSADQEGTVVVIGDVGAGKSTVIASLLTEMENDYKGRKPSQSAPLSFKPTSGNMTGLPPMDLSTVERTTTTYAPYALKNSKIECVEQNISNITLIDTRGLGRDCNEKGDIKKIQRQATIELNHIFKTRKIKGILLVVNKKTLSNKRGLEAKFLYEIADFFSGEKAIAEHLSQSLAVVITYPDNNLDSVTRCYASFGNFVESVYSSSDDEVTPQQKALVDVLLDENNNTEEINQDYFDKINRDKVLTFHPLDNDSKKKLVDVIKNFEPIPSTAFKEDVKATTAEWLRLYLKDYTANCDMITFNKRNIILGSVVFGCFVIACHYGKKT